MKTLADAIKEQCALGRVVHFRCVEDNIVRVYITAPLECQRVAGLSSLNPDEATLSQAVGLCGSEIEKFKREQEPKV